MALLPLANSGGDSGMNGGNGWRIDKSIPITVLAVLLAQSLAVGIWVGSIDMRVQAAETWVEATTKERHDARIAVIESHMPDIRAMLDRIAQRLGVTADSGPPTVGR